MNRHIFLWVFLWFMAASAQELKQFTLEDLNFGGTNYEKMIPQNRTLRWWGDQLVRMADDTCWTVNVTSGREKVLFTRAKSTNGLDLMPIPRGSTVWRGHCSPTPTNRWCW